MAAQRFIQTNSAFFERTHRVSSEVWFRQIRDTKSTVPTNKDEDECGI